MLASNSNLVSSASRKVLKPFHVRIYQQLERNLGPQHSYDPKFQADLEEPITDTEAYFTLLKCSIGTGVLAMPKAFQSAGWLFGIICTVLITSFVVYGIHLLLHDMNKLSQRHNRPGLSYGEAMQLAIQSGPGWLRPLSHWLAYQVDFFLFIYHFGVDCVYVVFIAKHIKMLCDIYFTPMDMRLFMAVLTVPLILIFLIRQLKYLVKIAIIANLIEIICFVCVFISLPQDLPNLSERRAIESWNHLCSTVPLLFGTVMFASESVSAVLSLQANLLTPENYLGPFGIVNKSMITVTSLYLAIGFLGYWKYGDEVSGSLLNNLPMGEIQTQVILAMYAVSIFCGYALQGFVAIEIVWRGYIKRHISEDAPQFVESLVRTAMVIASVLCAIACPYFGLLLALVGSFCMTQLGIIYPGLVNICVLYEEDLFGPLKIYLWRSLLFIIVGVCGGVTGTVVSLRIIREQIIPS